MTSNPNNQLWPNRAAARMVNDIISSQPDASPNCDDELSSLRTLTLIYHEDLETEITGIIERQMAVARYTQIRDVVGARSVALLERGYHTDGKNHMFLIVADGRTIYKLMAELIELRRLKGHGLRGYITPIEAVI